MELDKVIELVTNIILLDNINDNDITNLIKYKLDLSKIMRKMVVDWNIMEVDYNKYRPTLAISNLIPDANWKVMAVWKAELMAKKDTEYKYGDYRVKIAEAYTINNFIKTIDSFIFDYHRKIKENNNLSFINTDD